MGRLLLGAWLLAVAGLARLHAASPAALVSDFPANAGPISAGFAVLPLGDGQLIVGGNFPSFYTDATGTNSNWQRIAVLSAAGELSSVLTNADDSVFDLVKQPDGKIIAAGSFTRIQDQEVNRIVRFNADFTVDTNFVSNLGLGAEATIRQVGLLDDGKIVLVGSFASVNGVAGTAKVARLNSDGTVDTNFVSRFAPSVGAQTNVNSLAIQPDGKVIIGGAFPGYDGSVAAVNLARLNTDGSRDTNFVGKTSAGNPPISTHSVSTVALQPDGKILIGGNFTSVNGYNRARMARLLTNGLLETNFLNGVTIGTSSSASVHAIAVQENGRIVAGGNFTSFGSTGTNRLVRLESDGTLDSSFTVGTGVPGSSLTYLERIALGRDGRIYVVGDFKTYDGVTVNNFMILNGDFIETGVSFTTWIAGKVANAADRDADDDPDVDGYANIVEFAFGTDPASAADLPGLTPLLVDVGGTFYPGVQFTRLVDADLVTLTVDGSTNVLFNPLSTLIELVPSDIGDGVELVTVRADAPLATNRTMFFRSKVTYSP